MAEKTLGQQASEQLTKATVDQIAAVVDQRYGEIEPLVNAEIRKAGLSADQLLPPRSSKITPEFFESLSAEIAEGDTQRAKIVQKLVGKMVSDDPDSAVYVDGITHFKQIRSAIQKSVDDNPPPSFGNPSSWLDGIKYIFQGLMSWISGGFKTNLFDEIKKVGALDKAPSIKKDIAKNLGEYATTDSGQKVVTMINQQVDQQIASFFDPDAANSYTPSIPLATTGKEIRGQIAQQIDKQMSSLSTEEVYKGINEGIKKTGGLDGFVADHSMSDGDRKVMAQLVSTELKKNMNIVKQKILNPNTKTIDLNAVKSQIVSDISASIDRETQSGGRMDSWLNIGNFRPNKIKELVRKKVNEQFDNPQITELLNGGLWDAQRLDAKSQPTIPAGVDKGNLYAAATVSEPSAPGFTPPKPKLQPGQRPGGNQGTTAI